MENKINWEKVGLYIAVMASFFTKISYITDMKERIAKLEVKVEHLESRGIKREKVMDQRSI